MILSRRVSLGGIQLDEIDEAVVIRKVDTGVTHEAVSAVNRMGGYGQRMTNQHWETLEVTVTFAINIYKKDLARRREVFDAVMAWAKRKNWLKTNEQPGKRMYAEKAVLPAAGDLRNWTAEYSIIFRAYGVPFWQEEEPAKLVISNIASGSGNFVVNGIEETVADVTAKNISGQTIKDITIKVGKNQMFFQGINLGGSETLKIHHRPDGLLQITAEGYGTTRDLFSMRSMESADDYTVTPGTVNVQVTSQRAVMLTVEAAGRWAS